MKILKMKNGNAIFNYCSCMLAALLLSGCGPSIKTQSDFDPEMDYRSYKTFVWVSENPMVLAMAAPPTMSPFLEERIMVAIAGSLTTKGFSKVDDAEDADFAVGFTIGTQDKVRVTSYPSTYGGYHGHRGYYYGAGGSDVRVSNYTEGTLAIDIFDVSTRKAAWHGWGSGTVGKPIKDDAKRAARYREVTDLILAGFPPPVDTASQ
ncbi:MAG: DUF4136 domain-containing protein [Gammaproteobacteria bacterium]|jgi:hypothetical protein